jgi:hypothetical protein
MGKSQRLSLNNSRASDLSVIIEPWATEINVGPGSTLDILIDHQYDGHPYVVSHDDFIEVYLWSGCTCRLLVDNVEVAGSGTQTPAP